jgi:hypothetical protein
MLGRRSSGAASCFLYRVHTFVRCKKRHHRTLPSQPGGQPGALQYLHGGKGTRKGSQDWSLLNLRQPRTLRRQRDLPRDSAVKAAKELRPAGTSRLPVRRADWSRLPGRTSRKPLQMDRLKRAKSTTTRISTSWQLVDWPTSSL